MPSKIAVVIPAAGFGKRMGSDIAKQFISVRGKTILAHTVQKIQAWAEQYQHKVVIMVALSEGVSLPLDVSGVQTCTGGKERADSVANALTALATIDDFDWAMVHDAARPMVEIADIEKLYQRLQSDDVGGILAEKVTATVKRVNGDDNCITATIPRDDLWLAQTPQLFRFQLLQTALAGTRRHLTDEASAVEALGLTPRVIEGSRDNIKITTAADLDYFRQRLTAAKCIR